MALAETLALLYNIPIGRKGWVEALGLSENDQYLPDLHVGLGAHPDDKFDMEQAKISDCSV